MRPTDLEAERVVVFKKGVVIDQVYFICEISYNKRGYFFSLFSIQELNNRLVLHMDNSERTDRIFSSYGNDFEAIANALTIHNG